MKIFYPDSSMLVPIPLTELKAKKVPKIPQVEKVLNETYGKFQPGTEEITTKKIKQSTQEQPPRSANPPGIGSKLDIIAK